MVTRLRAAEAVIRRVTTACKSSPPILPRTLIRGRKVVTLGEIIMMQNLKSEGLSISQIAARTGLDRKTVRKYLDQGLEAPVYGPRQPRERVIAPYEAYLRGRIADFPDLSGKRLFREIKAHGYKGGYTAVTDFLREARPPKQAPFAAGSGGGLRRLRICKPCSAAISRPLPLWAAHRQKCCMTG